MEEVRRAQLQEEILSLLGQFRSLVKSRGWEQLVEYGNAQVAFRTNELILNPSTSLADLANQEYLKGEIAGIRLFLSMPDTIIEANKAYLTAIKEDEDGKDSTGNDSGE